jgi:alkylated DNA repair dioxygenase AlkB
MRGARQAAQPDLFDAAPVLPEGMRYETGFLTPSEERELIAFAQALPLQNMNYKGFTARRRVHSFGGQYDFGRNRLEPAPPIPRELDALRAKAASWAGIVPDAFTHAMVAEYREGTPLGWHRDVPDFEDVVGVSLLAEAVMRFRLYPPKEPKRAGVIKFVLQPRSIYLLRGPSRWAWQHSIAPTQALRYSITFRTPCIKRPDRR